jgi:hypothetical protein
MVEQNRGLTPVGSPAWMTLLADAAGCYRRLARLAESQHDHVAQNRTDALIEVLSARQAELTKLAEFETVLGDARRNWAGLAPTLSADTRAAAETLFGEMRTLLAAITAADQNDSIILQQRKLDVGRELKQTTVARGVNRTYAAAAYGKPKPRMDVQR